MAPSLTSSHALRAAKVRAEGCMLRRSVPAPRAAPPSGPAAATAATTADTAGSACRSEGGRREPETTCSQGQGMQHNAAGM